MLKTNLGMFKTKPRYDIKTNLGMLKTNLGMFKKKPRYVQNQI